MTALLSVALCCAGVAFILGFGDFAKTISRTVLAIVLGAMAFSFFRCWLLDVLGSAGLAPDIDRFWPLVVILIAATGGLAFGTRVLLQRRREDMRRRHMHPRRPAPPSMPAKSSDDEDYLP